MAAVDTTPNRRVRRRASAAAAVAVGVAGLAMTLPFAAAYHVAYGRGVGDRPAVLAEELERRAVRDLGAPADVYRAYGRAFFVVMTLETVLLYGFSTAVRLRRSRLGRWGSHTAFAGLALALVGVFTDYGPEVPPSIAGEVLGWAVAAAGIAIAAVALRRARTVGLPAAVLLGAALPLSAVLTVAVVPHVPSMPFAGLHAIVVGAGIAAWRSGTRDARRLDSGR